MKAMILTLRKLIIMKFSGTILILGLFASLSILRAQWQLNGVAVCDTTGDQYVAANGILSDGAGGAFVVWGDNRDNWDIYGQRVDSSGRMLWGKQGKPVCTAPFWQFAPRVAPDGEGGCVVAWHDTRNDARDVYAQRVDKDGNLLWAEEGVQIVHYEQFQGVEDIIMASDSTFIIVWRDDRFFPDSSSINIQKVTKDGLKLWQDDGVRVSNNPGSPKLISDGKGGVFVIWPSGKIGVEGVLVQHIDRDGNRLYEMPGKFASIGNASWGGSYFSVCSDNYGGAYIAWHYSEDPDNKPGYIQRIDAMGNPLWGESGIRLRKTNERIHSPIIKLISKDSIQVVWQMSYSTYMQIYDSYGNKLYSHDRKLVNYKSAGSMDVVLNPGFFLLSTFEVVSFNPSKFILRAQKVKYTGELPWDSSGVIISNSQLSDARLVLRVFSVSDGGGGMITVWDDDRRSIDYYSDVYVQRVYADGKVGGDTSTYLADPHMDFPGSFDLKVYPNPFNNMLQLEFSLQKPDKISLIIYDVTGRKIKSIFDRELSVGSHKVEWPARNEAGKEVSSGIYFISMTGKNVNELRKVLLIR